MKKLFQQMIRFGAVGVFCTLFDYGLMVLLTELCGINYLLSSGISFSASTLINYLLSILFVFKGGQRSKGQSLVVFVLLSVVGLGINQLLMKLGVDMLHISYLLVKIGATAVVMVYNFITRKLLLDRPGGGKNKDDEN